MKGAKKKEFKPFIKQVCGISGQPLAALFEGSLSVWGGAGRQREEGAWETAPEVLAQPSDLKQKPWPRGAQSCLTVPPSSVPQGRIPSRKGTPAQPTSTKAFKSFYAI